MTSLAGRRVVVVTPNLSSQGGTEIYLNRLLRVQRNLGLQVCIVTTAPFPVLDNGVEIILCPEAFAGYSRTGEISAGRLKSLAKTLAERADWVEFHHGAAADLLYALRAHLPTLLFMHTSNHTCAALGRYLPRSSSCCMKKPGWGCLWSQLREGCLTTGRPSILALADAVTLGNSSRKLALAATRVVFNSQAMQRLFEHSIVSLGDGAEILHPPIEIPLVQQRARSGNLLYVGRFFEQKGVNDAIRVAAALPGRRLDLYGSGRGDADARSLAQKSGVNACFHPWGSADVVAQAMASAACLLVPTRMFEAWGMVGPEAIAQGCPVVAYDAGGVREWLAPEYGEVVPQGNLIAMVEAVRRQLARCEAGLDTSGWRKAVDNCWGLTAFSENYTRLIHALP